MLSSYTFLTVFYSNIFYLLFCTSTMFKYVFTIIFYLPRRAYNLLLRQFPQLPGRRVQDLSLSRIRIGSSRNITVFYVFLVPFSVTTCSLRADSCGTPKRPTEERSFVTQPRSN